jgi:hypothetical protein
MSEALDATGTLRLVKAWRIPDPSGEVATIQPMRVVAHDGRTGDRDALRALVAEIVREELRSDLGRRMTGSIRRLVRDEVSRLFSGLGAR